VQVTSTFLTEYYPEENSIGWNADVRVNFEFNPKIFSVDVGAGLGTSVLITNRQTQRCASNCP